MQNKDTWTLGRSYIYVKIYFGFRQYNLNLIRAAVEDAGAEIITLALRRVNNCKEENILDYIRKGLHRRRTLPVREMPKRLFVW